MGIKNLRKLVISLEVGLLLFLFIHTVSTLFEVVHACHHAAR